MCHWQRKQQQAVSEDGFEEDKRRAGLHHGKKRGGSKSLDQSTLHPPPCQVAQTGANMKTQEPGNRNCQRLRMSILKPPSGDCKLSPCGQQPSGTPRNCRWIPVSRYRSHWSGSGAAQRLGGSPIHPWPPAEVRSPSFLIGAFTPRITRCTAGESPWHSREEPDRNCMGSQ